MTQPPQREEQRSVLGALSRVLLGSAVLLERQMREALTSRPATVSEATAVALGVADRTAAAARQLVDRGRRVVADPVGTGRSLASARPLSWVTRPAQDVASKVSGRLGDLATRGHAVADSTGEEAARFLKGESDRAIAWARTTVVPPIVEDLANNDQIRDLVFNQALGAVSDASRAAKGVAGDADARVEAGFQRLLRRGKPADDL